jgi:hypothetical protein
VVTADQPVAAVANVTNSGVDTACGQYRAVAGSETGDRIFFPLVKHNHFGRTTSFFVQNVSHRPASVHAVFRVAGNLFEKRFAGVPAYAAIRLHPAQAGVPAGRGQVGSLVVESDVPLAGVSIEHPEEGEPAKSIQAARALVAAEVDTSVYCPLIRSEHTEKRMTTGLQVQNLSPGYQQVTVTYGTGEHRVAMLAPQSSHTFYTPDDLPAGTVTSATVTGSAALAALVNDSGLATTDPTLQTAYTCFSRRSATGRVVLPLVKEHHGTKPVNQSGVQVQNVGARDAVVRATYRCGEGDTIVTARFRARDPLAPGRSFTFYAVHSPPATLIVEAGTPAALAGKPCAVSLEARAPGGGELVPVVAMAVEASLSAPTLDSKSYEGFNLPE